jgi:hypothetical protein
MHAAMQSSGEMTHAGARLADENHRFRVVDKRARRKLVDGRRGDVRRLFEVEVVDPLEAGELGVPDAPGPLPLVPVLELGLDQRPEVGEVGLLGAGGLFGHGTGARAPIVGGLSSLQAALIEASSAASRVVGHRAA